MKRLSQTAGPNPSPLPMVTGLNAQASGRQLFHFHPWPIASTVCPLLWGLLMMPQHPPTTTQSREHAAQDPVPMQASLAEEMPPTDHGKALEKEALLAQGFEGRGLPALSHTFHNPWEAHRPHQGEPHTAQLSTL